MKDGSRKLYWLGNAAKARVISEILSRHPPQDSNEVIVFDFGCGDGGDWPVILRENSHIKLVGLEPGSGAVRLARKRLQGCNAEIWGGEDLSNINVQANYVVSFSVLEHVVDKVAYLNDAKRLLATNGLFYLNYDDGHFRNELDLSDVSSWLPALRARGRTIVSPIMAALGRQENYQQRVSSLEVDKLVTEAGFVIERVDYHNLASLKALAKVMPGELRESFSRWWVDIECDLNERFSYVMPHATMGDSVNLWREMGSRTLCLRHFNGSSDEK